MTSSRFPRSLILLLALALFSASCSSSGDDPSAEADATTTTLDAEGGESTTTTEADTTIEEATATTETVAVDTSSAEFESGSCEFAEPPNVDTECGWITVPQHWNDPSDPDTIRLHVATFTTDETPTDAEPVIYLDGGPGSDTLGTLAFSFTLFESILDQHPLVLFTQRGSAGSEVDLVCEEVIDLSVQILESVPDPEAETDQAIEAYTECVERLEGEGADLSAYHSVYSAHDVDAIRQALGYDQWNVLGISYGTRLGQELVRTHPEGVRSIVLDSVQPTDPNLGSLAAVAQTFDGSLDQLFAGCEANAECAAANPNLEERLRAVIAAADAEPFEFEAIDQLTAESYDVIVDDQRLLSTIFSAMYSQQQLSAIPEMIGQLEAGDDSTLATLVGLQLTNAPFISNGMYNAVMCHDFLSELTPESAWDAGDVGDPLFDELFTGTVERDSEAVCDLFPTGSAPPSIIEPVQSDVPTMIMSGAYDPITPPWFADAIAPGFSNGQVAVLPHAGHAAIAVDCGMEIALAFWSDPTSEADQSCIATSAEPIWIVESLEGVDFEPFSVALLGLTGVAPTGWTEQGPGVTVRNDANVAHQLVLLQQGAELPAEQFVGLLSQQLGGEAVPGGELEVAGRTWSINNVDSALGGIRIFTAEEDGFTFLVAAIGPEADIEDLQTHVLPTVFGEIARI